MLLPASLTANFLRGQVTTPPPSADEPKEEVRLPNGKRQQDEILKAEYHQNLKESRDLVELAKGFQLDLEKDDRFVLSVSSLKKLDDMEKTIKRIRGRLKKY